MHCAAQKPECIKAHSDLNAYFCDILTLINQGEVGDNLEALDIIMLPECLRGDQQCHRVNAM
jgi:hypothetical protein